jgi:hypothetical protein
MAGMNIRRRDFIAAAIAAAAWPSLTYAQQAGRRRKIGIFLLGEVGL